ncbi:rod shape-determining protein MreC [Colwellia sp. 39_35_sub15_T18]|nr:rod shape-determining protein MreC [Colwellia sp. 39_35_sub15_T18]
MNPIFKHGPSPQYRLVLVLFCSALLIFFDHKMASFESVRGYLQSLVSPLQYIANTPKQVMTWASENLTTRQQLMTENHQYRLNELSFHEQGMQLEIIKQENARLRTLLASPLRSDIKKMVAEVLAVDSDPYTHQVVINRGANDGVYEGQVVLDAQGIVGQILHVGQTSSRVILITDISHAVPVRVERNGLRLLASGSGRIDRLTHNFVPHSADIQTGDTLVTSGLGGKYPEGYPVATVSFVSQDESREFVSVYSVPIAQIDRLRYLLLLSDKKQQSIFAPKIQSTAKAAQ